MRVLHELRHHAAAVAAAACAAQRRQAGRGAPHVRRVHRLYGAVTVRARNDVYPLPCLPPKLRFSRLHSVERASPVGEQRRLGISVRLRAACVYDSNFSWFNEILGKQYKRPAGACCGCHPNPSDCLTISPLRSL